MSIICRYIAFSTIYRIVAYAHFTGITTDYIFIHLKYEDARGKTSVQKKNKAILVLFLTSLSMYIRGTTYYPEQLHLIWKMTSKIMKPVPTEWTNEWNICYLLHHRWWQKNLNHISHYTYSSTNSHVQNKTPSFNASYDEVYSNNTIVIAVCLLLWITVATSSALLMYQSTIVNILSFVLSVQLL